jgi:hypothetical protein
MAGGWGRVRPLLDSDVAWQTVQRLHADLEPKLRLPVEPVKSERALRLALGDLRDSIHFFNQRWTVYVRKIDLTPINKLRDGYNRFYLLEKECALGSIGIARQGFRPILPLTHDDVLAVLPTLPEV